MIKHLDYQFPKDVLLKEAEKLFDSKYEIKDPSGETDFNGFWLLFSNETTESIAKDFLNHYNITTDKYIVNYLVINKNCSLPWHADKEGSVCAINVILTDDPAPIEFENKEVYYDTALIDIRSMHRVSARPYDRIVFRITFQDEDHTFAEVSQWLK